MKKWILVGLVVVALIVGGVIFATKGGRLTQEEPATAETPAAAVAPTTTATPSATEREAPEEKEQELTSPQPTPSPVKEDDKETAVLETKIIKMTIEEFFSEFFKPDAGERYKGETVQLLGKVKEIEETPEGYLVSFYSVGFSGRIVRGSFQEISSIEPGQKTIFRGEVTEASWEEIILINCLSASPVRISAKDLHSEFEKNPVAAELKYKIELLEVTGAIGKIGMGSSGKVTVHLSDAGYAGVRLDFTDEREIATLSKGEKITVRGWLDTLHPMLSLDVVLQDVRLLD